ncbi:MAG: winged helix-turn-helix transcriptional regulator [Phycisphaerae bacterium]|nr:winged helix-turn-helix transcriptional regulator [Phycisphaerae bacterium]
MLKDNELIPEHHLRRVCETLRALTHPDRLRICELLLRGDCCVGELAREIALKPNVVSQHLNHLKAYGIVRPQRDGRVVYYHVVSPAAGWLLGCIRKHMHLPADRGGDADLDRDAEPVVAQVRQQRENHQS